MKLERLTCPSCGAQLSVNINGMKYIFCNYCGQQIQVDDGTKRIDINQNITINQSSHQRITNDAEVIKAMNEQKESKHAVMAIFGILAFLLIFFILLVGSGLLR